jgi:flagellar P-ring protein precursor FlgI
VVTLNLHDADFTTAARIVSAVDAAFGAGHAHALDGVTIEVTPPSSDRIAFLAQLESLEVNPGAAAAKVIVSARTGTVVTPQSNIEVQQEGGRMFMFQGGTSLEAIVRAVNAVGAAPGDIVAILEALKRAGALRAELEVI